MDREELKSLLLVSKHSAVMGPEPNEGTTDSDPLFGHSRLARVTLCDS